MKALLQKIAYRAPILSRIFSPAYPFKVSPGQLAFLCDAIDATREVGGAILEIGVARGSTSVFLLEHMRTRGDDRTIYLLDTFSGFTGESIRHEVEQRGKDDKSYNAFRYGDEAIFCRSLHRLGYRNFATVAGDASKVDYGRFGPISVVLLDIDLYLPTKLILEAVWPHLTSPGFICIDDCLANTPWDGSLEAYSEFITAHGLEHRIVGNKGGALSK